MKIKFTSSDSTTSAVSTPRRWFPVETSSSISVTLLSPSFTSFSASFHTDSSSVYRLVLKTSAASRPCEFWRSEKLQNASFPPSVNDKQVEWLTFAALGCFGIPPATSRPRTPDISPPVTLSLCLINQGIEGWWGGTFAALTLSWVQAWNLTASK